MKHIIIPISKVIWAITLTILCAFGTLGSAIIFTIWDFKLYTGVGFETVELGTINTDDNYSPYAQHPKRGTGQNIYKTYFHYIWGIIDKK